MGTMPVGETDWASGQIAVMQFDRQWRDRWLPAARAHPLGLPLPFKLVPGTSANSIHTVHHLFEFQQRTGFAAERVHRVIEFEGGYG